MQNILYYWFCSGLNMRAESFQEFSVADNVKDKHDVKNPCNLEDTTHNKGISIKENINLCPMHPNLYSMEDINDVSNTNAIGYAPN